VRDGARATVTRCVVSTIGNNAINARGDTAGTTTTVSVSGSTLEGGLAGAVAYSGNATATVKLAVSGSQVDRNDYGLYAVSGAGGAVTLTAAGNVVTNSVFEALFVSGTGAKGWATGNTMTDNGTGLSVAGGGVLESAGDNAVRNNTANKVGTISVVARE